MSFSRGLNLEALSLTKRVQKYSIGLRNASNIELIYKVAQGHLKIICKVAQGHLKIIFKVVQGHLKLLLNITGILT